MNLRSPCLTLTWQLETTQNAVIILGGDFNVPQMDWSVDQTSNPLNLQEKAAFIQPSQAQTQIQTLAEIQCPQARYKERPP